MNSFNIERYSEESDGIGGVTQDWKQHTTGYGYVDMLTGRETTTQNAFTEESTHVLVTDTACYDIEKADRVVYNEENYEITFVDNPLGIGHHLEIYLKRVA